MEETYCGEKEIVDELDFPMLVDPAFVRESRELYLYRHDGGFWLGFLPHEDVAMQIKLGAKNVFVDGERIDSSEFLDSMRRVAPDVEEIDGLVVGEDPGKVAEIDIPFETWVKVNCVTIEEVVVDRSYGVELREVRLERYTDEIELWEEAEFNPFA